MPSCKQILKVGECLKLLWGTGFQHPDRSFPCCDAILRFVDHQRGSGFDSSEPGTKQGGVVTLEKYYCGVRVSRINAGLAAARACFPNARSKSR